MEPSESAAAWRRAYARQAISDFEVYDHICKAGTISECHRLHYLQMALEKSAKAFFWAGPGSNQDYSKVNSQHKVVKKYLPDVYRHFHAVRRLTIHGGRMASVKQFCQEVDLLAPASDKEEKSGHEDDKPDKEGLRPDNCEYPWHVLDSAGAIMHIQSPLDYEFSPTRLMKAGGVVLDFLRVIRSEVQKLAAE